MLTLIVAVLSLRFTLNHLKKLEAFRNMTSKEIQVLLKSTHLILQTPMRMDMRSPALRNKRNHHHQVKRIQRNHQRNLNYLRESMKERELNQIQSKRQSDKVQEVQTQNLAKPSQVRNLARNLMKEAIIIQAKVQVKPKAMIVLPNHPHNQMPLHSKRLNTILTLRAKDHQDR